MSKKIESIYVHVPFCKHLCNYCDFFKKKPTQSDGFSEYENLLLESWGTQQNLFNQYSMEISPLKTLYLGGGTPSYWGKNGILFLKEFFQKQNITFQDGYEFTLEIDPATTTIDEIHDWKALGVNRFSVGLQAWDEEYLKIIDRIHTIGQATILLNELNKLRVNFSVDFMLGFPKPIDRERDIIKELQQILIFQPKHISLYILSVKKNYPFYNYLPDDEQVAQEFEKIHLFLTKQKYDHYEVSNYALEGFQSQHNLKYWKQESVAAIGPSATGLLKIDEHKAIRYKWDNRRPIFQKEELGFSELQMERIYTGLRSKWGVEFKEFNSSAIEIFHQWQAQGLAEIEQNKAILTHKGLIIVDSLIEKLFPYFKNAK